ncbi:MAG: thiol-disulfide isomerase/thioredoxin [Planctomycetota bacterium]|jgi:thiol-disulfide isomerase/thioredoxin
MSKKIIAGGVVVIIIIAIMVLSGSNKESPVSLLQNNSSDTAPTQNESTEIPSNVDVTLGGYEEYAPEHIAFAETGNVVLFFRASWCPSCRVLDKDIVSNLGTIPADLKILQVDFDNSKELRKKYGVTTQHTLVQIDKDGNKISKWSGSPTLSSIIAQVQ